MLAYGTYIKYGRNIYRANSYLQWGNSDEIIGACIMCNPGDAKLEAPALNMMEDKWQDASEFKTEIRLDDKLTKLVNLLKKLYKDKELKGIFYIYNLFTLQNAAVELTNRSFKDINVVTDVLLKDYDDFIAISNKIPWILLAWGCDNTERVHSEKVRWFEYIKNNNVKHVGVKGKDYPNYIHLIQYGEERQESYNEDIISQIRTNQKAAPIDETCIETDEIPSKLRGNTLQRLKSARKTLDFLIDTNTNSQKDEIKEKLKLRQQLIVTSSEDTFTSKEIILHEEEQIEVSKEKGVFDAAEKLYSLEEQGDAERIIGYLLELSNETQDRVWLNIYNGKLAEKNGEKNKAFRSYQRAVNLIEDKKHEAAFYLYICFAQLLYKSHRFDEALELVDKALIIKQDKKILFSKIDILFEAKRFYDCMDLCRDVYRKNEIEGQEKVDKVFQRCKESLGIEEDIKSEHRSSPEDKLNSLIGLSNVKRELSSIMNYINYERKRCEVLKLTEQNLSYHFIFKGNPGTGKTTVAKLLGEMLVKAGVLKKGHVVEVDRSKLVGQYVGQTAVLTRKFLENAVDGILFVDEAYALCRADSHNDYGIEAIDTLVKAMDEYRGRLVVILAGYTREMDKLVQLNPGLNSRVNVQIEFSDYSDEELLSIAKKMAGEKLYDLDDEAEKAFTEKINKLRVDNSFANGRTVRNIIDDAIREKAFRLGTRKVSEDELKRLSALDFGINIKPDETVEDVMEELNTLIGLSEVKTMVKRIIDYVQIQKKRKELGFMAEDVCINMIFTGSPGTGKTTVARIISKLFKQIGILKKGQLVEVTREDLIGEYIGQTAAKTSEKVKEAYGGVLFIDEAYSLSQGGENDYGKEAIASLIKEMEDYRDKLIVIMAGYTDEMGKLMDINPGLKSRIGFTIEFQDYNTCELLDIFKLFCSQNDYILDAEAETAVEALLNDMYLRRDKSFGNGRLVRQIFEKARMAQANRIIGNRLSLDNSRNLITIKAEDISFI